MTRRDVAAADVFPGVSIDAQVAAVTAHDLANLLAVIRTSADSAADGVAPESTQAEALADIRLASERAIVLVARLAQLGRAPLPGSSVRVDDAIDALLPILRALGGPAMPIETSGSPTKLRATIAASELERILCVLVVIARDAGATKLVIHASRRFARGSGAENPATGGTYVRLAVTEHARPKEIATDVRLPIVRIMVESAGGRFWQEGTSTILDLPARDEQAP
jgi:signal transduction histidine kinase